MTSNFTAEEVATYFQAFLNRLSASETPVVQSTSTEPPSSLATASVSASQTPSSLAVPLTRTGIPPITQLYQPSQQGHPAPSLFPVSQPPAFHPFIGTRPNLPATSIANQARLASAQNTIPRQVSLPQRGRRRGVAQQPPILSRTSSKISIQQCFVSNAPVPTIRAVVRVFPPLFESKQKFLVYQNLRDSVDSWLTQHHLLHRLHLPISTPQTSLITSITTAMITSPLKYQFPSPRDNTLAPHESLSLQPLGLSAKGAPRANGQIYLRPKPVKPEITLSDLMADKTVYSGKPCIEGGEWGLYFTISSSSVTFIREQFRHTCLGYWFYRRFSDDMAMPPSSISHDDDSSGGEPLTEGEDENMAVDTHVQTHNQMPASLVRTPAAEPSFVQGSRFLPSSLWVTPWTPPPPTRSLSITLENLTESVYESAAGQSEAQLLVTGHDFDSLVVAFEAVISDCISAGDFTQLLLPNRTFQINRSNGDMQTIGPGLERDTVYTAFNGYARSFSKWFLPRFDNRASLQMSCGIWRATSAGAVSENRILAMKRLGAICALVLIHGMCPEPLNPLLFQFIIHNGDFNSLHRALIQEWHPELLNLIDRWLAIGPNDSLEPFRAHFASYHDMDISVLDRNIAGRAPEILYYAIFGPEPPVHPEWKAFIQGFLLKCQNGFTFLDIPKSFEGGSEAFLSLLWTSIVTGYESIRDHILISQPPSLYAHAFQTATGVVTSTIQSLIREFFQGSGIPCPALFAEVQDSFSPLISIDKVDAKAFRSQMFLWAATGSPTVNPDLENILITVASDTDPQYSDSQNRQAMLSAGKISFRTCMKSARLPGPYILGLAHASYPSLSASGEPHTFSEAFNHWFLCEILTAVGGHSML